MDITAEVWKDVVGYEGHYKISNQGRVKALTKTVIKAGKPYVLTEKILAIRSGGVGYSRVQLCKDGALKEFYVHRLVGQHFIPNPDSLPQINHMDSVKLNNYVSNLEWCTASHNQLHRFSHARMERENE